MFNREKKVDSKVRFQRQTFKNQLKSARGYKRVPVVQQDERQRLKPLSKKVLAASFVLLAALLYFVYLPNPLNIKSITIIGLNSQQTTELRLVLAGYFTQNPWLPQNNLLLLNEKSLRGYLLEHDQSLTAIGKIKKLWPRNLEIMAAARENFFILSAPEGTFLLGNDNLVSAYDTGSSTTNSNLPKINIFDEGVIKPNQPFDNPEQIAAINFLAQKLPALPSQPPDYYQIQNYNESEITVYLKDGSKFLVDYKNNLADTVNELSLLLTSIAPQDLKRLSYVDMTVPKRGYVCLKGTACAKTPDAISGSASSSSSSTLQTLH